MLPKYAIAAYSLLVFLNYMVSMIAGSGRTGPSTMKFFSEVTKISGGIITGYVLAGVV